MAGVEPPHRSARPGLRPALFAIVASTLVVGGIAVATNGDGSGSSTLPPVTIPTSVPAIDTSTSTTLVIAPPASITSNTSTSDTADTVAPVTVAPPTVAPVTVAPTLPATTAPSTEAATTAADVPSIDAKAYAVYDVATHTWLATHEADTPLPVGSVMKLLTTYVVLQAGNLDKTVTVPALQVDSSESSIGLYKGETLARDVLLRAMLIVSANDAARTLAIDVGGTTDAFVGMMNAAAAQLGLTSTVAANPIGLDAAGAHSSARDMVSLAALLMQDGVFRQAVGKATAHLHGQTFSSTNRLLTTYPGADGVKTGHTTDAGYCLVGSATRNGREVIVAVLGAASDDARLAGATALLDWAFNSAG
jgi:D-alanyl-D-alanine carboxypeptidase (penicillin-binding protein 5/6)